MPSNRPLGETKERDMKIKRLEIIIVLFFIVILVWSCTTNATEPTSSASVFQIHLQSWFDHTPVTVSIDHSQIYSDTISTGEIIGIAHMISYQITNGTHLLHVTVSDSISKDTVFTIQDTLYIGVNFNIQNSQINFYYSRYRFLYD